MTVKEAKMLCEARLRDWLKARELNEQDWRSYALIVEDCESARRELVKAAQKFQRRTLPKGAPRRVTGSMTYFDVCCALREPIPHDVMRLCNTVLEGYLYDARSGVWYHHDTVPIGSLEDVRDR